MQTTGTSTVLYILAVYGAFGADGHHPMLVKLHGTRWEPRTARRTATVANLINHR